MPREIVKSQIGPYHVKVGWSAHQDVQLGVELEDLVRGGEEPRPSIFNYLIGSEQREELARRVSDIIKSQSNDSGLHLSSEDAGHAILDAINEVTDGGYLGLWSDLDRHGINQLIRILRKARDAAYGKDE